MAHDRLDKPRDPGAGRPGADEQYPLPGHPLTARPQGGEEAADDHGGGSLDVVVEAGYAVAVAVEQADRVVLLEVLPLQDRIRIGVGHRDDERLDEPS
jgi:hypothetical protein